MPNPNQMTLCCLCLHSETVLSSVFDYSGQLFHQMSFWHLASKGVQFPQKPVYIYSGGSNTKPMRIICEGGDRQPTQVLRFVDLLLSNLPYKTMISFR